MFLPPQDATKITFNTARYGLAWLTAYEHYWHDFASSYFTAARTTLQGTLERPVNPRQAAFFSRYKLELLEQLVIGSADRMLDFHLEQASDGYKAWLNTLFDVEGENLTEFTDREATVMEGVAYDFPKAIEDIKHEFGFQLESGGCEKVMETECFTLYRVKPTKKGVRTKARGKPVLLVPPYLLGAHILAFLPGEGKSYAHAYANNGVPTYVRIVKDIDSTLPVQTMTCEDDCEQTAQMCAYLKEKHGHAVSLSGVCQGGFISLINVLSGRLEGLVDTLISVVTPVDGTRSAKLGGYMKRLPSDLSTHYAYDTLPNGNKVVNGEVMSLAFKLLALSKEAPLVTMYNLKALHRYTDGSPGKTAAAINRWLRFERVHLPPDIAEMSAETYRTPISADGGLPVKLFGEDLNLHDLKKLGVQWYIAYARDDDLVEKESAIAAVEHLQDDGVLEVAEFPGGHVAILTSHAGQRSKCPLDGEFNGMRGPVHFHMSLTEEA